MMMKEEEIKEHLMSANPEFRQLVEEHKLHEGPINRIAQPPPHDRTRSRRRNPVKKEKAPAQGPDELHDSEVSE